MTSPVHELGQISGDGEKQGGLVCCSPWGHKKSDMTGRLNNNSNVLCAQLSLTFCEPMDYSPLGSSAHGFSRQEYLSVLPFPSPGDLTDPGIKPESSVSPTLEAEFFTAEPPIK